ncbi:hypothetical protein BT96DRAFT_1008754 [Gymnopus androsaceus JB14]|uniref:Uncharacterized protein n=1 Tax=Gymnopus androsaceus JB14 TaxID=1447944 RepID=A0A6A4GE13_9AGAR|nr:hypothetical protein BT96DRAFT_1008754 [Gymnopus androsaceus JB14]
MASLSSSLCATDSFITSTLQKFSFRNIKLNDIATKNLELFKWNNVLTDLVISPSSMSVVAGAGAGRGDDDSDGGSGLVDDASTLNDRPIMLSTSAIYYLPHAYDCCPEDPMVSPSRAIALVGRAIQRQSDNRHHLFNT